MKEKKRCNAASQKPLKSTFTLLFCVGDIKPSCFYSANHWWIVHVNYWLFLKSTTLNLRQMDSTGRRYLSMNDRLFCVCVFQDLFQVGEIIEALSHAKLEVVQSWTLSPLTSQRPRFNHFPFPISTLCSGGAGKRQTFTAFCISSRFILNEITLDPDELFQKTRGCGVHVFDGLPADYVGGWAWSRAICCEQMKVAL